MRAIESPRLRRFRVRAPVLAVAMAALMTGTAQAGPSAGLGGQASLTSVSCRGASWCMAVGSHTTTGGVRHSLAMIFNGTAWRTLKDPAGTGLHAVSCSSATFCMAEGGPVGAERWNGTSWRALPGPRGGLASLTCASRAFCVRVHGDLPSVWNGRSWHDAKVPDFCKGSAPGPCWLASVSCGSAANCVAVGTWTVSQEPVQNAVADRWNGKRWTWDSELPANGNPAQLNTVGCAGAFCMSAGVASNDTDGASIAVADKRDAATRQGWTDVSPSLGGICGEFQSCAWAGVIACGNSASCITLGGLSGNQFWNGSAWQPAQAISAGPGSELQDVSCGGNDCLAVGFRTVAGKKRTLAELWNGSAWTIINTPK
jgi:hypothetical protein